MQVVKQNGATFGTGSLIITDKYGKPKLPV